MRDSAGTEYQRDLNGPSVEEPLTTHPSNILATSVESFSVAVESTVGSAKRKAGSSQGFDSEIVDRYRLEAFLGKGGFGEVWKAFDTRSGKYVAIKGPRTDRPISPLHVQQFLAEAEKAQQIGGGAVVPVLEVVYSPARQTGEFLCFIVMEMMTGGSLGERARKGERPTEAESVALVIRLADKLAQIHGHGFIHRDVKPDNILFDAAGKPYFSDFGLAVSDDEQLKEDQCVRGTVAYMAPEQARQQRVDRQADIYSLGVVLYQLLALPYVAQPKLALPYLANNSEEYLELLSDQRQQARALPDGVPNELAEIVEHRCLTADKTQRFRNAQDLARALRNWQRRKTWPRRVALIAGCGLAAAVVGYGGYRGWFAADENPQRSPADPPVEIENAVQLVNVLSPADDQGWKVDDKGRALELQSGEIMMVAFGKHQNEPTDWEITLVHEKWERNESFGLFFGLGHADKPALHSYQALTLTKMHGGDVVIRAGRHEYQELAPQGLHPASQVNHIPATGLLPRYNSLRIRLVAGVLQGIWFNRVDLFAELVDPWIKSKLGAHGQSIGQFGVYSYDGPCTWIKPVLNGKSVLLLK